MNLAIGAIRREDMGLNVASKAYDIPKAILSRHEKNQNVYANEDTQFHGEAPCLGDELEDDLVSHCLALEKRYCGLTMDDLRRLSFQIAESNSISHAFSKTDAMGGKTWYYGFMRHHPELSLRQPESTTMVRAQDFNKPRVV